MGKLAEAAAQKKHKYLFDNNCVRGVPRETNANGRPTEVCPTTIQQGATEEPPRSYQGVTREHTFGSIGPRDAQERTIEQERSTENGTRDDDGI